MRTTIIFLKRVIIIVLLIILTIHIHATQYNFSGNITDTASWWQADTINIIGNVTVTSTGKLIIPAEKTIIFQGQHSITVNGEISVKGRIITTIIGKKIIRTYKYCLFTYKSDTTNLSNPLISTVGWKGISLTTGSKGYFYMCRFQYAKSLTGSLFVNSGNTTLSNCYFNDNKIYNSSINCILQSYPTNPTDSLILSNSYFYNNSSSVTVYAGNKLNISGNNIYNNVNTSAGNISDQAALTIAGGNGIVVANKVFNNSKYGINVTHTNMLTLDKNYIYNNKSYGIKFYNSIVTLTNNLIVNNALAGYIEGTTTTFINNTIAYNKAGVQFVKPDLSGGSDVYFYNSIIWNNNSTDITGNMNISVYNSLLPYSSAGLKTLGLIVRTFQNNLNTNPVFKTVTDSLGWNYDASYASWQLQSSSPCINLGITAVEPNKFPAYDFVGTARIKQGMPDIGAYELFIPIDSITTATVTTPTLWVADTVKVFNNVTINIGGKLTIAAGTVVSFQGDYYLKANGGLIIANGVKTDSIVFTRQNPVLPISSTTGVFWGGINIQASTDSCLFKYCRFDFAQHKGFYKGAAINVDFNDLVSVRNSVFRYNVSRSFDVPTSLTGDGSAIAAFNSDIIIDQCRFTDNLGSSTVYINSSNTNVSNCYFTRNQNDLKFNLATNPVIYNTVSRSMNSISSSNPQFVNCEFYGLKQTYLTNSNPRYFNSVCFSPINWNDESAPQFFNCMFKNIYYNTLSKYAQNAYLPVVDYLPSFSWDEGSDNFLISNYTRNSFYPSINKGLESLPAELHLPSTDILGKPRISSSTIDIGAIEQQGNLPLVTLQPVGSSICTKNSVQFIIANTDTAIYQWQKDGSDIIGAVSKKLSFKSLLEENAGTYVCKLVNSYGTVYTNSATLQVKSPPELSSQTNSGWITANSPFTINASVNGSSPLEYIWYKDGNLLNNDTTGTLNISAFGTTNEGLYYCEISNSCGKLSSNKIILYKSPELISNNKAIACVGDTFKWSIAFNDNAQYQWLVDGVNIPGAISKNYSLVLTDGYAGNISCRISNTNASVTTSPVFIQAATSPKVLTSPVSGWVDLGSSFTLLISGSGSSPLIYQWVKNNGDIAEEKADKLKFAGFTLTDEGIYQCKVTNLCGSQISQEAFIFYSPKVTVVNKNAKNQICEGDTITLSANSGTGSTYQWYKDGTLLSGSTSATVVLNKISVNNTGNYYCIVTRSGQSKQTETKTINVQTAPEILLQPSSQWAVTGNAYTIEISAGGSKPIDFELFKDGLSQGSSVPVSSYTITGFDASKEGRYYVKAHNFCNTVTSADAYLYISPKITITNNNGKSTICESDIITLSANSGTGSTYQWYKDGNSIKDSTGATLVFKKISLDNTGNYYCVVTKSGMIKQTETRTIGVQTAPSILSQPASQWIYAGRSHELDVVAEGSKPITYSWTRNNTKLNVLVAEVMISEFAIKDEGNYKCIITNVCGVATTQTARLVLSPELTNTSGSSVCENDTFELAVNFTDTANYKWLKEGKDIDKATGKTFKITKITNSETGNYQVRVSNASGYAVLGPVQLTLRKAPTVESLADTTYVDGTLSVVLEALATGDEPFTYQWYKEGKVMKESTSQSLTFANVTKENEKAYKCLIKNICNSAETNETKLVIAPQLCMVTNDFRLDTNANLLVWDRNSFLKYHHFNIYREGYVKGKFDKIGEVPYKDYTYFIDKQVNPKSQAYVYKITAVDSNKVETNINATAQHKTIHLLVTEGVPQGIQLDWDEYIGFDYNTYSIWRSEDDAPFDSIHSMASTSRTWTDYEAPTTKNLKYFVSVSRDTKCDARAKLKAGAGPFASAISNMEDNSRLKFTAPTVITGQNLTNISLFPNPFYSAANIKYVLDKSTDVFISLTDLSGRTVEMVTVSKQLPGEYKIQVGEKANAGIYFIKIKMNNKSSVWQLVKVN